jgi:dTDP-glucose 4,6-dehydratase
MKMLVTGGLGFIGSNFIKYVLTTHRNIDVVNIDKIGVGANPQNLHDLKTAENYRFLKGDITDASTINHLVKDVDYIVNFAAETHVDRSITDPSSFLQSNLHGTFRLLEAMRRFGQSSKFIQISTDEIYGDRLTGSFIEADRLHPSNPYSASKAAADLLCIAYHRTYGLNVCITRCTNNFGPYQFPEKFIPKTIIRALRNLPIPIYGTGQNVRDWIYVLDHCEAIHLVLTKSQPGEIYNIASGNEYPNLELATKILTILGKSTDLITFVDDRPGHDMRYSLNASKIRRDIGWKATHPFSSALKTTVNWYRANDWWWRPLATEHVLHSTPWKQ